MNRNLSLRRSRNRPATDALHSVQDFVRRVPYKAGLLTAAGAVGAYLLLRKAREMRLAGRIVLITGASRGFGLLLAREFARHQARVVICARHQAELNRARSMLADEGADVLAITCDVTDPAQIDALINQVIDRYGRIDVLVNNAGIIQVGPLESMAESDFASALDVMFWGMMRMTFAVLPHMRVRNEGRIVNITSIGGMVSIPHLLPYDCAKFAAVGLSQGLHAELRASGIKVVTIVPGTMRTGSHLRAEFRGQEENEYTWFSLASSTPLLSLDARRAARQVVQATRRGQALRILGLPANIMERLHGLFPGLTTEVISILERLLPPAVGAYQGAGTSRMGTRGADIDAQMRSSLLHRLTELGRQAARRNNEIEDAEA